MGPSKRHCPLWVSQTGMSQTEPSICNDLPDKHFRSCQLMELASQAAAMHLLLERKASSPQSLRRD